jgi:hypothetical protein
MNGSFHHAHVRIGLGVRVERLPHAGRGVETVFPLAGQRDARR